jgi:HlyD family secretion protein
MKKVLLIALAVVVTAGLVGFMVYKQQSGYTKVLTAKLVKQDLATVVSGTGQIKPKTYVNVGATSFGRITHLYVKEGDHVKRGQIIATVENVQPEANVDAQKANIAAEKTDIASYISAEKNMLKPIWSRKNWIGSVRRVSIRPGSWPNRITTPRRLPTTPMWPR